MYKYILITFLILPLHSWTQGVIPSTDLVLLNESGIPYLNAWAGGMETPQYGSVDLNQDGSGDIVVFDNRAERFLSFIDVGENYKYTPKWNEVFKNCDCRDWAVFADYNCDGLSDLFCRTRTAEVSVFKQELVGLDSVRFINTISGVRVQRNANEFFLAVAATDIPAIVDVDHDGDLDFFSFGVGSNFIEFAKNEAMETLGRCDTLVYQIETSCWGHFRESDEDNTAFVADTLTCPLPEGGVPQSRAIKHVGSTTLLLDLDADSTFDALIGDTAFDEVYALFNGGTPHYAFMDSVERNFPQSNVPISVSTFPACFYVDVDRDGIRDLLVAPHSASSYDNTRGTWLYMNRGADDAPNFSFQQTGFLQEAMLDVGTFSYPAVGDVTGDGLPDILVGNRGYFEPNAFTLESAVALLENVGSSVQPSFQLTNRNFLGIRASSFFAGLTEIHPAIGDVDGDEVPDILLGNESGTLYFFKGQNENGVLSYSFVTDTLAGIDVGRNSAPFLYDVDKDQDLDLLIGNRDGYIQYYENLGVSDVPEEAVLGPVFQLVTDTWGGVRILDQFGGAFSRAFAQPWLIDLDRDGEEELLLGGVEGEIEVYENVENALVDSLEFVGILGDLDLGTRVVPTGGFLDDSGFPTLLVGNEGGGLHLIKIGEGDITTHESQELLFSRPFSLYPNPVGQTLFYEWKGKGTWGASGRILDVLGRSLWETEKLDESTLIDVGFLPLGSYIFQVQQGRNMYQERFIKN